MEKMNKILYSDEKFATLKDLYAAHAKESMTYSCFLKRIESGSDIATAQIEFPSKNTRRTYTVNGIIYSNLKSLSIAAGISYDAAVKRKDRGFTDDEIFSGKKKLIVFNPSESTINNVNERHSVAVNGITYENISDAHKKLQPKASYNTVRQRIKRNWTLAQALEVEPKIDGRKSPKPIKNRRTRQNTSYIVDEVEYASIKALADAHMLSPKLVYNRIRDNHWSAERAVKEPIYDSVTVEGVIYRSAMYAWETVGETNFLLYQSRKTAGLPLDICLGLAPLPKEERYQLDGKVFSSIAEVAEAFNLTTGQLQSRLKNMSLMEAVKYLPANGRYTFKRFRDDPELAATQGILYFIKIASADLLLHKIGITQRSVEIRFQSMEINILARFGGPLEKLFRLEQEILQLFQKNHYRADEDFEGKTETFLLKKNEEKTLLCELDQRSITYGIQKFTY